MRNERREITIDTTKIQRIVRHCYEQLYAKKFETLDEIDKFLEKYSFPKLNKEAESLNKPVTTNEFEAVIKKTSVTQKPWTGWSHRRFFQSIS